MKKAGPHKAFSLWGDDAAAWAIALADAQKTVFITQQCRQTEAYGFHEKNMEWL
jgi:hypothetical protein